MSSHQEATRPQLLWQWQGQVAKLASQPAELGPGQEQWISTAWHIRCITAHKMPKYLPFAFWKVLVSTTTLIATPGSQLNWNKVTPEKGAGAQRIQGYICSVGQGGWCHSVKQMTIVSVTRKETERWQKPVLTWHREESICQFLTTVFTPVATFINWPDVSLTICLSALHFWRIFSWGRGKFSNY